MRQSSKKTKIIREMLWDTISSGLPGDHDIDTLRKYLLLNSMMIVGTFFIWLLIIVTIVQSIYILSMVNFALSLVLVWLFLHLRRTKNHGFVGIVGTTTTGIFFLFLIAHGGIENTAYLWAMTYPIISLYLLGRKQGTIFSISFCCLASVLFILGDRIEILQNYNISLVIRFVSVYATIFLMGLVTEFVREKVQGRLKNSKYQLENAFKAIQDSTVELTRTNRKLLTEIDERKRIEKALKNSETFLDDIIESIQDGISVLDTDLTIRHTNSRMKQWYQRNLPLVGKKCYECYHDGNQPCEACPTMRCLQSGKFEQEIVPGLEESPVEWLEVFSFPIRDRDTGKITGAVEFVRDITVPKRLERQLAHAQKMEAVGTLAGGVAHDLNNILSGIVSYPELLLMDLPQDSPMKAPIETIQKSGKKAAAIVQDLLTLARRGVYTKEVINLNDAVSSFLSSPECSIIKQFHPDVAFEVDLQPDLLNIIGSPVHVSKTIMNLISNAAEAIPKGGTIRVATCNSSIKTPVEGYEKITEGEYVVLAISDSGSGISPEDLHKIFEPFYTKKSMGRSGTGLGMTVVWGTVKDLDGFIDVKSSPGEGTTFHLYLPITRQERARKKGATPMEVYMGGETILVVDDVAEQRDIASAMLEKLGYSVAAVSSGEESILYLNQHQVDILILDMVMEPGMDGLETYQTILKDHPGQKAVIASGYSETDRVKAAQRLGAGQYIKKPYTLERLGLSVRSELDK
jgi:PAS domain S-box-containing protein